DIDSGVVGQQRGVDVHVGKVGGVDAAGGVIQRAVEQLDAVELRRVGAAVNAVENGIDLNLIGGDFFLRQRAGVGGLAGEALHFQQQSGHFAQRAFSGVEHVGGAI